MMSTSLVVFLHLSTSSTTAAVRLWILLEVKVSLVYEVLINECLTIRSITDNQSRSKYSHKPQY